MKINWVYDFYGLDTIPNSYNFNRIKNKLGNRDINPIHDEIKNLGGMGDLETSDIENHLNGTKVATYSLEDLNSDFLKPKDEMFIYPIKLNNLLIDAYLGKISLFENISNRIKIKKDKKNLYFLIEYLWEGEFYPQYFYTLYFELTLHKIPKQNVIFVCNTKNINQLHETFLNKNNFKDKIHVFHGNACMNGKYQDYINNNSTFVNNSFLEKITKRESKALILNRRLRAHRVCLLTLLAGSDLLSKTKSSFDLDLNLYKEWDDMMEHWMQTRNPFSNFKYIKKFRKGFKPLSDINKILLDYSDLDNVIGLGYETPSLYENTYFSLVTETLFFEQSEFVSEKTFKPISQLHPFIILGSPHSLKYLREYGFKTFNNFWDESYDEEVDDTVRFIKVWELLESLLNKSDDDWIELLESMKDILIYNRNLFITLNKNLPKTITNNLKKIFENEPLQANQRLF